MRLHYLKQHENVNADDLTAEVRLPRTETFAVNVFVIFKSYAARARLKWGVTLRAIHLSPITFLRTMRIDRSQTRLVPCQRMNAIIEMLHLTNEASENQNYRVEQTDNFLAKTARKSLDCFHILAMARD